MRKPWEPPEKRPSVSNATSWPSPAPINADDGFNISRLVELYGDRYPAFLGHLGDLRSGLSRLFFLLSLFRRVQVPR
jgi:hypothetical protein